ncbi:hypothetical protein PAEPH01_1982, partial [Pancytospora epiphaga]
ATTNLSLVADKNSLVMSGTYNGLPIGIEATMRYSNSTAIDMRIYCDKEDILDRMVAVFE